MTTKAQKAEQSWEGAGLSNDFIFCKVMGNPDLCKKLLEMILGIEIEKISYPEAQKTEKPDPVAKGICLDVYVKDAENTVYDIEMQTTLPRELPKRTRYYQGVMDVNLLDSGHHYSELNNSYIIFICLKDFFGEGRHVYTFKNYCCENKDLPLGDGATKIFLNASGTMDDVDEELEMFFRYLLSGHAESTYTKDLEQALQKAKSNRDWRREYMEMYMRDYDNRLIGEEKGYDKAFKKLVSQYWKAGKTPNEIAKALFISVDEVIAYEDQIEQEAQGERLVCCN